MQMEILNRLQKHILLYLLLRKKEMFLKDYSSQPRFPESKVSEIIYLVPWKGNEKYYFEHLGSTQW